MRFLPLALMALLMQSCGLSNSEKDEKELLNKSALYDPPTVTLIPGEEYQFEEGTLKGSGQRYHSQYSYQRALIIGGN